MDPQRWPLPINCLDVEDKLWETKNKGGSKQKKKKERKDACPKPPFLYLPAYRMVMHLWYLRYLMYEVGFVEEDLGAACFFFFFSFLRSILAHNWLACCKYPATTFPSPAPKSTQASSLCSKQPDPHTLSVLPVSATGRAGCVACKRSSGGPLVC